MVLTPRSLRSGSKLTSNSRRLLASKPYRPVAPRSSTPPRKSRAAGAPGLRAENCLSGDRLTVPAAAGVVRKSAPNQLGNQIIQAAVAKQRLRGLVRLRRSFRH
jgi:hypothetical protein